MPSVVIIHAADDALPARALAEKLRAGKLTVMIEQPPGEPLRQAVKEASAVVALWSPRSIGQPGVVEEVAFAKKNGGVIHARMQNAANPDEFKNDKSIDLTGWRGEDEFIGWRDLAKAVTAKAGVPNIPLPGPKPPSGFFQPGMVNPQAMAAAAAKRPPTSQPSRAPQQQAPRTQPKQQQRPAQTSAPRRAPSAMDQEPKRGGNMMMIAIITFVVVALAGGGGFFVWNNMQSAKTQAATWETVDQTDPAALRTFISGSPGEFRDEAQSALAHLEEQSFDAAKDADSIEAFQSFLADFPESSHALEARGKIQELRLRPTDTAIATTETLPTATADPDLNPPTSTTTAPPAGGPTPLSPPTTTATTPPG